MKEIRLNLAPLIKKLEVSLKRGETQEYMFSAYRSKFKGRGLEFEGFRAYLPGMDDAKKIDWKSSLRSRDLLVRVHRDERNLNIFILFDVSDTMLYSSTEKLKCEYAAELVATLCYGMLSVGDKVGICMFNQKIVKMIPGGSGMRHFHTITRTLSDPKNYGGRFNLSNALKFATGYLPHGGILFIVSDFLGLEKGWKRFLAMTSIKYDLTAFIIRDPRDMTLPEVSGQIVMADPLSDSELLIDTDTIRDDYEAATTEQLIELTEHLTKTNSDYIVLFTDTEFFYPVLRFFERRRALLR